MPPHVDAASGQGALSSPQLHPLHRRTRSLSSQHQQPALPVGPPLSDAETEDMHSLLQQSGLGHLLSVLEQQGVDDLPTLASFSTRELRGEVGIANFADCRKLEVVAGRGQPCCAPDPEGLRCFLLSVRLSELEDQLLDCGLDSVGILSACTEAELRDEAGVAKVGHRRRMRLRLDELARAQGLPLPPGGGQGAQLQCPRCSSVQQPNEVQRRGSGNTRGDHSVRDLHLTRSSRSAVSMDSMAGHQPFGRLPGRQSSSLTAPPALGAGRRSSRGLATSIRPPAVTAESNSNSGSPHNGPPQASSPPSSDGNRHPTVSTRVATCPVHARDESSRARPELTVRPIDPCHQHRPTIPARLTLDVRREDSSELEPVRSLDSTAQRQITSPSVTTREDSAEHRLRSGYTMPLAPAAAGQAGSRRSSPCGSDRARPVDVAEVSSAGVGGRSRRPSASVLEDLRALSERAASNPVRQGSEASMLLAPIGGRSRRHRLRTRAASNMTASTMQSASDPCPPTTTTTERGFSGDSSVPGSPPPPLSPQEQPAKRPGGDSRVARRRRSLNSSLRYRESTQTTASASDRPPGNTPGLPQRPGSAPHSPSSQRQCSYGFPQVESVLYESPGRGSGCSRHSDPACAPQPQQSPADHFLPPPTYLSGLSPEVTMPIFASGPPGLFGFQAPDKSPSPEGAGPTPLTPGQEAPMDYSFGMCRADSALPLGAQMSFGGTWGNSSMPGLADFGPSSSVIVKVDDTYEEVEELGSGAFGRVVKAIGNCGGIYAIKKIGVENAAEVEGARQEFATLRKLDHDNIVRVCDCFVDGQCLNIVMEFMAAGSIHSMMEELGRGGLEEGAVRAYTYQTLQGLHYLHRSHIVHSDIKPRNLLVGQSGEVKLADFGLSRTTKSKISHAIGELNETLSREPTEEQPGSGIGDSLGSLRGTVMYMSPRLVCMETNHTYQSDIWAVGCTVLEMATGRPPWSEWGLGSSNDAVYLKRIADCRRTGQTPAVPPELSRPLQEFLQMCFTAEDRGITCAVLMTTDFLSRRHAEIAQHALDAVV
eukprot:TRINITY_DN5559_c0_g1_i1.p1 TRINITY_DN5559_c0_g1~~TRINITY_DN5559_c0_g1_i1.p1  ORF type:complete len:1070 (+),score=229.27 TRINITY_DN5559_c0_g1_i1:69-3212(+)